MKPNSELTTEQLEQLIELASGMHSRATGELDKWHQRYLKPRDNAEWEKSKNQMDLWGDKLIALGEELDALKFEQNRRAIA